LYRDTNGWCPFCERVWVCIRAKNLPYQERLIALFDKPEWYKEMVPTTQVPAVLFHEWDSSASGTGTGTDGDNDSSSSNSRKLVWESIDIMQALDDAFPNTIQLVHDTPEYKAAKEQVEKLNKVGFEYIYATRNTGNDEDAPPLTEEEIDARREAFVAALDELNASLEKSCISDGDGDGDGSKPVFALGDQFSGIDAIMIPTLERWRYQLPLNSNIDSSAADILKNRPFLQKWFESMEGYKPFSDRVMGDEYSWIATNAMFAKYFGAGEETAKRSEDAASALVEGFCDDHESASTSADENGVFALEAARKIVSNREAIVKDCSNADPKSQASLARCKDADVADAVIRFVAEVLVKGTNESESAHTSAVENARSLPLSSALEEMGKDQRQDAALAAKTVASRLCAPRDMSAPAAKILRSVLMTVGNRLV
jgi:glutathione S-transferase